MQIGRRELAGLNPLAPEVTGLGESGGQQGLVLWLSSGVIPDGPPNLGLATVPRPTVTVKFWSGVRLPSGVIPARRPKLDALNMGRGQRLPSGVIPGPAQ